MTCNRTKLDSTERLTLQDMARGDDVLVTIRRATLDDLLHDLGFWEQRIAALEAELELANLLVEAWHGNSDEWQAENGALKQQIAKLEAKAHETDTGRKV